MAWHQDGWTHWDSPASTRQPRLQIHGPALRCTAANGLWVVPGSHRRGKADIKAMVEAAGSDRLPDAVPLVCGPGDVAIPNRQAMHGSFATARTPRHDQLRLPPPVLSAGCRHGGVHNAGRRDDEERIRERSRRSPTRSTPGPSASRTSSAFVYQPFAGQKTATAGRPEALGRSRTTTCSTSASEPGGRRADQPVRRPAVRPAGDLDQSGAVGWCSVRAGRRHHRDAVDRRRRRRRDRAIRRQRELTRRRARRTGR